MQHWAANSKEPNGSGLTPSSVCYRVGIEGYTKFAQLRTQVSLCRPADRHIQEKSLHSQFLGPPYRRIRLPSIMFPTCDDIQLTNGFASVRTARRS